MKKTIIALSAVALFSVLGAESASASTVTRSFDSLTPAAGSSLTVSLAVDVTPPDTFYIIDEIIPTGWTISNAGTGDTTQAGHIKWAVLSGAVTTALQYTVSVPAAASGVNAFSGEFAFDSNVAPLAILGQTSVNVQAAQVTPVLTVVTATPAIVTISPGATQQLTAAVKDQLGANFVGATLAWTSNNNSVATVDAAGLVIAVASGNAIITATAQSGAITVTGTANITVSVPGAISQVTRSFDNTSPGNCSPVVVSLAVDVTPPDTFYIIDEIIPTGWTISNAGTGDTTQAGHIKWAVLSAAASTQLQYTAAVPCTASGAAVFSGEFAFDSNPVPVAILGQTSVNVQVTSVLNSIAVTPNTPSIVTGATQQLTAQGADQFGASMAVSPIWTSSNEAVATVSATGLVTAVSAGTATITATSGSVSGSSVATVAALAPTTINITPSVANLAPGGTQSFVATALDQLGNSISAQVVWTSSNPAIGTINASGLFTAVAAGNTIVTAASGQISATAQVTVAAPTLTTVRITPASLTILPGASQTFTAATLDQFGNTIAGTPVVVWTSSNSAVGTIDSNTGIFNALALGQTTITAASGAVSATALVNVSQFNSVINLTVVNQWVVFSAPKKLTVIDIVAADIDAILMFDSATQQFVQITNPADPELFNPLNAFFAKPNKQTAINFTFNQPAAPETIIKVINNGWNLIGSNNTGLAKDELSSIQVVTADNTGIGMTTLFVPQSHNARKNLFVDWGADGDRDINAYPIAGLPAINMSSYDGYWVNMRGSMNFAKINQ